MKNAYLFLLLLLCGCKDHMQTAKNDGLNDTTFESNIPEATGEKPIDNSVINGIYYGTSEGDSGRRAWLLKIENDDSVLYSPPANLTIRQITRGPKGEITFETERAIGDLYYKFVGRIVEERFEGVFESTNSRTSTKASTTLRRLDRSLLKKGENSGLFSNVEYVEQGGDLVGSELIVIPFLDNLTGIYTSYENEMTPYATKIEQNGDKISFHLQTGEGIERFDGKLSRNEVRLDYSAADGTREVEQIVMPKKKDLIDLFRK